MAIVTMKKLTLIALQADKESIFNALVRTRSVELKRSSDIEACARRDVLASREACADKVRSVEDTIQFIVGQAENYNLAHKRSKADQVAVPKSSMVKPMHEVDFDYYLDFGSNAARIERDLATVADLRASLAQNEAALSQKRSELGRLQLIAKLPHPTTWYKSTDSATVQLMQLNATELVKFNAFASGYELVDVEVVDTVDGVTLVVVVAHKSQTEFFENAAVYGLVKCPVTCDVLPKAAIEDIERQIAGLIEQQADIIKSVAQYTDSITEFKVYVDYLGLTDDKLSAESDLVVTAQTFVMEAYYPAEQEDKVTKAIRGVSENVLLTLEDIGEEEFAPTLIKSNKVVKPFESITNMFSPPAYHGLDPNPVMSVFYFIIFGFMVADMGYGALLLIAGIVATFLIKQQTGIKTMLQLFGMCGLSAVIVGALFGSAFCFTLYDGIIPSPDKFPMVMMIICLALGMVHICAGIGCKMALKIKHKQALSAWLADFPWIIVFAALIVAIFNMAMDMAAYEPWSNVRLPDIVSQVALYVCLGALAIGVIFAGLGQKGILNKAKSSFGSVYGIINYFSDVMSYIRVFGLMLSGALVGSVINNISQMVAGDSFGVGYILAGVVLIIAHVFNMLMSVLSVYIHNGRLQYVEFFGKFYEGDGALFTPFGSNTKYTLVIGE